MKITYKITVKKTHDNTDIAFKRSVKQKVRSSSINTHNFWGREFLVVQRTISVNKKHQQKKEQISKIAQRAWSLSRRYTTSVIEDLKNK